MAEALLSLGVSQELCPAMLTPKSLWTLVLALLEVSSLKVTLDTRAHVCHPSIRLGKDCKFEDSLECIMRPCHNQQC